MLEMDRTEAILLRKGLGEGGSVQQFFASECARHMDPYIPYAEHGGVHLKTNYSIALDGSYIQYHQPYATRQYFENKGRGLRGKMWDKRMWADRGTEIVQAVAAFAGVDT
jgi:hypothetical protein